MRVGSLGRAAAVAAIGLTVFVWCGAWVLPALLPGLGPVGLIGAAVVAMVVAVVCLAFTRRAVDEPRISVGNWWPALVPPVLGAALMGIAWLRGGGPLGLVTSGDMVWNTAQSLFIHADGGVLSEIHPNPAPLTNLLFAASYGPSATPSLGTVFAANSAIILLLALASSLCSGLYVARRAEGLHSFVRLCLVFAVGWIPFTGVLLGGVVTFGHANMLSSYLVLWLAWIIFGETVLAPFTRTGVLLALSTVVLASWAPLLVLPIALAVVAGIGDLRHLRKTGMRAGWRNWLLPLLMFAQLVAYGLLVTLPDLRRDGEALSQDGATPSITPQIALGMLVLIVLAAWGTARAARGTNSQDAARHVAVGVSSVLVLALPALAYMFLQRVDAASFWGYYPVKFIIMLVMVISAVLIGSLASVVPRRRGFLVQTFLAATAIPLFAAVTLSSFGWVPGVRSLSPSTQIIISPAEESRVKALAQLVQIYDRDHGGAQLAVGLTDEPTDDQLANSFLIQLSAERSTDPVRDYAYSLDTVNTQQICDLIALWDRGVTVHTVPERLSEVTERLGQCAVGSFVVVADTSS